MKAHDFGQFLFNSSIFGESQLWELILAAKNIKPTFSTSAIFLRLVSTAELVEVFGKSDLVDNRNVDEIFRSHDEDLQKNYDEVVRKFLDPHRFKSIYNGEEYPSIQLAQILIDSGLISFSDFEKTLENYHHEEIPPVERIFGRFYDSLRSKEKVDYPPALDVARYFHAFLSEELQTSVIFSATSAGYRNELFGASVKLNGAIPIVAGVIAEKNVLHNLANSYDKFVSENIEEDFDAVAEMLNVFTGNFAVKVATSSGLEEELYPPRFGVFTLRSEPLLTVIADVGKFYLYIGAEEIFKI